MKQECAECAKLKRDYEILDNLFEQQRVESLDLRRSKNDALKNLSDLRSECFFMVIRHEGEIKERNEVIRNKDKFSEEKMLEMRNEIDKLKTERDRYREDVYDLRKLF